MTDEKSNQFDHSRAAKEREVFRRRLDQCLGCHWGDPGNVQAVSHATLTDCSGNIGAKQRLSQLRLRGIAEAVTAEENGLQRKLYKPTDTDAAREYVAALPKAPCKKTESQALSGIVYMIAEVKALGTTTPKELADANVAAEQFLLENTNVISRTLLTRRHMLGCLACHLFGEGRQVNKSDIAHCAQRSTSAVEGLFEVLEGADLLTCVGKVGQWKRKTYELAATDQAREFASLLTPPEICDFKAAQQLRAEESAAEAAMQPPIAIQQPPETPGLYSGGEHGQ